MMTTASTVLAVVTTPLLTKLLLGALVPVDASAMLLSTVQLVLAPVLLGAAVNQWAPAFVSRARLYTPVLATALVALIVGSMTANNSAVVMQSGWDIAAAVLTLHGAGFALGYGVSKALGLSDRVARTNCIEVRFLFFFGSLWRGGPSTPLSTRALSSRAGQPAHKKAHEQPTPNTPRNKRNDGNDKRRKKNRSACSRRRLRRCSRARTSPTSR